MAWHRCIGSSSGGGSSAQFDALIDRSIMEIESNVTSIGKYAFNSCKQLTSINFPAATSIGDYAFIDCVQLTKADFPAATSIGTSAFSGCTNFGILILRKNQVCTLAGTTVFSNTPFASGKAGGKLYVPQALIEDYQYANRWGNILGYPNNQILPIEGSIYE